MATIIKKTSEVTILDITTEAREVLRKMSPVSEKYKEMAYKRERSWYWMDLGFTQEQAELKADQDWEWIR